MTAKSPALRSVVVSGVRLEYALHEPERASGPTLALLHEGLGCVAMWRDFPARLAKDTGCRVIAYSRRGYGGSDSVPLPRPLTYMQHEGREVLPELLRALGVEEAVLVGHSDGGSIALVYAGSGIVAPRVRGLVLMAPHVFCEPASVASIVRARVAFDHGSLRAKLAHFHGANVDAAFRGWNDAWLDPRFLHWSLESFLTSVRVPVLAIQGEDDPYGTLAQIDAIEQGVRGSFARLILPGVGHDPARMAADVCLSSIKGFVETLPHPALQETSAP